MAPIVSGSVTPPTQPGSVVHDADGAEHTTTSDLVRLPGLAPVAPLLGNVETTAKITTRPSKPEPREPFRVDVYLRDAQGRGFEPEIVHERPIHMIVVSNDLADFQHVHPEGQKDAGHYALSLSVARGQTHQIFAEYKHPAAPNPEVGSFAFGTSGPVAPRVPLEFDGSTKIIGKTSIQLGDTKGLRAGSESTFAISVSDTVTLATPKDLQPWLGAPAHGIIIDSNLRGLVHAHAMTGSEHGMTASESDMSQQQASSGKGSSSQPTFLFHASFEHAGLHKIWVQFQRAGEVITAPFVVDVK